MGRGFNATIYVKNSKTWDEAKEYARSHGIALSTLVERGIRDYIKANGESPLVSCRRCKRIRQILRGVE